MLSLPAAAAVATATAATAAATGALLGLGNVNADGATVKLSSVEGCNGLVGRLIILKGDKAETARAAGVAIADHDGFADLAVGAERIAQALVVSIPTQTSNKQFLRHISLLLRERCFSGARSSRKSKWTLCPPLQKPAPLAGNRATI